MAKHLRYCINCSIEIPSHLRASKLCKECQEELATLDVPEPMDLGNQICWHSGWEVKIHHCESRKKVATEQYESGKTPQMIECYMCGKSKGCTPKKVSYNNDFKSIEKCIDCGREFKKSAIGAQKYCRACANARQKSKFKKMKKEKKLNGM